MNRSDSNMLLKDFLSVVHGEIRDRIGMLNVLNDGQVQFEELVLRQ